MCVCCRPTILLANAVSGEEEVPAGVKGVITKDAPDVLAHISVRARNLKVHTCVYICVYMYIFFVLRCVFIYIYIHTYGSHYQGCS